MVLYLYYMTIGEKIRTLRKSKGWTQVDLAEKLGTSQKVITTYETGRHKPPLEWLPTLARLFGVSIEELIGKNGVKPQEAKRHVHKNSRLALMQKFYEKLPPSEQRVILKQVKNLVGHE